MTPAVLWHLAVMAHARGDRAGRARPLYLELLALAPQEPTLAAAAHRGLALIALAEGRVPDALERYSQACALDRPTLRYWSRRAHPAASRRGRTRLCG